MFHMFGRLPSRVISRQNPISVSEPFIRQIGLVAVLAGVLSILGFAIHPQAAEAFRSTTSTERSGFDFLM